MAVELRLVQGIGSVEVAKRERKFASGDSNQPSGRVPGKRDTPKLNLEPRVETPS
jgi:hypothetical protein